MFGIDHKKYIKFIASIHQKLDYNIECVYCDQGITDDSELNTMHSQDLFDIKFREISENDEMKPLFSELILNNYNERSTYDIVRICRFCRHHQNSNFEYVTGRSFKDVCDEMKTL